MENNSGKIYTQISKIMKEIGAVGKSQQNKAQDWMFRGIDDVMNALYPVLSENNVFAVPNILKETHERVATYSNKYTNHTHLTVEYKFFADDGSYVSCVVSGESMDTGDKSTSKAMSIAFKYALFQTFCIPTKELRDSDPDNDFYGDPDEIEDPKKKAEYEKEVVKTEKEMNEEIDKLHNEFCSLVKDYTKEQKKPFIDDFYKFDKEKSLMKKKELITSLIEKVKANKAA